MSISISNISQTGFTVNWTAHSGSVGNYNIEVRVDGSSTVVKSAYVISSTVRSYGITGLSSCTDYEVKLYSKTTSGTTNVVEYSYPSTSCPAPGGVGTIAIDSVTTSSIEFDWSSATNAYDYNIEVYVGSSASGTVAYSAYNISSTYRNCTGLNAGTTYTAKVWAENSSGDNGTVSTKTSETQCATPSWSDYYGESTSSIYLDWGSITGADEYQIYNVTTGATATTTSSYYTWTGLSSGTTYTFQVRANNTWYGAYSSQASATTLENPPSGVGTITTGTKTPSSIQIYWSSASGADYYAIDYKPSSSGTWTNVDFSYTGTSYTITGLNNYTSYDFKVYARNSGGNGTPSYLYDIYTTDGRPATPSNFRITTTYADGFDIAWNSSSGTNYYFLEVYHVGTGSLAHSNYTITGTTYRIPSLNEYVTYDIKLWATNSYGGSSATWLNGKQTLDATLPLISYSSSDGNGRIYLSWTSSDAHSGIRSSDGHIVYIASGNTTSGGAKNFGSGEYISGSTKYYTWVNANGVDFVHNKYYWVRVYSIDNAGNWSIPLDQEIQYKVTRPNNWSWWTTKSAGANFDVKADEWNSLGRAINLFRTYKNLDTTTFTEVISGGTFYATMFNAYRNAINDMSPPTAPPTTKSAGQDIKASDLNLLVNSLNSIP